MFGWFGNGKEKAKAKKSADLRAQAMDNMRGARERLGDDTIQQMAANLRQENKTETEKARDHIRALDKSRIADNLKAMMDDK